ncbi:hypothetical protein CFD26_103822 [Aspergillus turcosus]|uniref:Flavin-containing monooxygenase 1 n=1 Tax=Aspergillus turcosus TaxID=1245748 RepID=A0A421D1A2_9EURO|nr:hypothetical protein CFD26_103822 [Aspergillus turcosus]
MTIKVAIVGAGISGLATTKQCLAEGFSVTVFEARDNIGGQWYYEEPDPATSKAQSSMYEGTISNTCRDTSSFSDFPMDPARYPDFYGHRSSLQYLHEYADHFGLKQHILFNTKVVSCQQMEDDRWKIKYTTKHQEPRETVYDALLVCSGKSTKPHIPVFKGMESFQGRIFHSHIYRRPEGFSGKRVAIIGFGNSAADIASEICGQTEECHLVTRRGGWVLPRYIFGKSIHAWNSRFSQSVLPTSISKWSLTTLVQLVEGKLPPQLQPEHDILGPNPAIHSSLIENIKVGRITPHRAGVGDITATGLSLTNGETINNLDAIILCTGYDIDYPFISEDCYRSKHSKFMDSPNSVHLYRLTVPPHIRNLFIMGVFQLPGPIQPAVELQARWVTAILTGRIKLPPAERMSELIASEEEERGRQWIQSDRHTVSAHFLPYCDLLANDLGAAPTFGRLLSRIFTSNPIRAIAILHAVYFGMCSSAQYRLFGDGSKPALATATILRLARGGKQLSEEEKSALTKSEGICASAVSHVDNVMVDVKGV